MPKERLYAVDVTLVDGTDFHYRKVSAQDQAHAIERVMAHYLCECDRDNIFSVRALHVV